MWKRPLFGAVLMLVSCTDSRPTGSTEGRMSSAPVANTQQQWRTLPLITDGEIDPTWLFTGYGKFSIDGDALRTDCDPRGLGLLVYTKEKLGDCEIRIVYRSEKPKSNSGVYVRIDNGIVRQQRPELPPAQRTPDGKLTDEGLIAAKQASEKELGPWYAVHHGYEVQIADAGDEMHRTGAIYSLAKANAAPTKDADAWRTMIITLRGEQVSVELDGKLVSSFDAARPDLPAREKWHEPKREPKRPTHGYIGLQTHDPGDVVWFREVSVRSL